MRWRLDSSTEVSDDMRPKLCSLFFPKLLLKLFNYTCHCLQQNVYHMWSIEPFWFSCTLISWNDLEWQWQCGHIVPGLTCSSVVPPASKRSLCPSSLRLHLHLQRLQHVWVQPEERKAVPSAEKRLLPAMHILEESDLILSFNNQWGSHSEWTSVTFLNNIFCKDLFIL